MFAELIWCDYILLAWSFLIGILVSRIEDVDGERAVDFDRMVVGLRVEVNAAAKSANARLIGLM